MNSKIEITKRELLDIANAEFINEPCYREGLKISEIEVHDEIIILRVETDNEADLLPIINSQEFADRICRKFKVIN